MRPNPSHLGVLALLVGALVPVAPSAATGLAEDPWVVVAVVDSGINPYHVEFAASAYPGGAVFSTHPSLFLSGYPASSSELSLTLSAPDYASAKAADAGKFAAVQKGKLYWIPGTKIIGAVDAGDDGFSMVSDPTPILDDYGHGTRVASVVAGNTLGTCPRCLLVVVEDPAGLKWATEQPWIDIVVNSWTTLANVGVPNPDPAFPAFTRHFVTRAAAECGQSILFASGNGAEDAYVVPETTYLSNELGPGWVLRVGGYVGDGSQKAPIVGNGKPVDVLGKGSLVPAAEPSMRTKTGTFAGTSAAAPWVAGVLGSTLLEARELFADTTEGRAPCGSNGQVLAEGAGHGEAALADGVLTRAELWETVLRTARPTSENDVYLFPLGANPKLLAPMNEGWGAVDRATLGDARAALLGGYPPVRSEVALWMAEDAAIRDTLWGAWDKDGDGDREAASFALPPVPVLP